MSLDVLIEKIKKTGNPTAAGLDPKLDYIPDYIKQEAFEKIRKGSFGCSSSRI
jgi:orotidine-5'-phosphate decarboxylase